MAKIEISTERAGVKLTPYELFKEVQQSIKVGKGKYNSFAKFYFRSVEDIYEAWTALNIPLVLKLSDDIIIKEGRLFLEATAEIKDLTGKVIESSKAQAELGAGKAGMSSEQATGSASSYARKYALNGLFLLNDSKDPDEEETTSKRKTVSKPEIEVQQEKIKELQSIIRGDKIKTDLATKLIAGRSVLKISLVELQKIIDEVKK